MGNRSYEIVIHKTWRSEAKLVVGFLIASIITTYFTVIYPQTVLQGKLFSIGSVNIVLDLPLLWFLPIAILLSAIIKIYNVRYYLDKNGIRSVEGILALNQKVTSVKYEDIRLLDVKQSIIDRILGIGTLEVGTAATSNVEISLRGIVSPYEVKRLIQSERDARRRLYISKEHNMGGHVAPFAE